jgi:hypothetical protein
MPYSRNSPAINHAEAKQAFVSENLFSHNRNDQLSQRSPVRNCKANPKQSMALPRRPLAQFVTRDYTNVDSKRFGGASRERLASQ